MTIMNIRRRISPRGGYPKAIGVGAMIFSLWISTLATLPSSTHAWSGSHHDNLPQAPPVSVASVAAAADSISKIVSSSPINSLSNTETRKPSSSPYFSSSAFPLPLNSIQQQQRSVVAFQDLTIQSDCGVTVPVACWYPVNDDTTIVQGKKSTNSKPTTTIARYRHRISVRKIGQLLAGMEFIPEWTSRTVDLFPTDRDNVITAIACNDEPFLPNLLLHESSSSLSQRKRNAPVVILAHGFLGSRFDLSHLAEQLASLGFVCFAPEYPESLSASYSNYNTHNKDVVPPTVLNRAEITATLLYTIEHSWNVHATRYGIVGHSLGCTTALETGDETWTRVLLAGLPNSPPPPSSSSSSSSRRPGQSQLLLISMNDGLLTRFGGVTGPTSIPSDYTILDINALIDQPQSLPKSPLPSRAVILYEGVNAPNHISFLADNVNAAMIDVLSPLLPVAQALRIPVLDFDKYRVSRDSVATARLVHPIVSQYLSEQMMRPME